MGFATLHVEHHTLILQVVFAHVLYALWEGTILPQSSLDVLKCVSMCKSATWISSLVLLCSSPNIVIPETVYKMYVHLVIICKY